MWTWIRKVTKRSVCLPTGMFEVRILTNEMPLRSRHSMIFLPVVTCRWKTMYVRTINADLIDVQEASFSIPANVIDTVLPNWVELLTVDTEFM